MVTGERWRAAQEYERGYWKRSAERIARDAAAQLGWYGWRADQLANRLRALGHDHLADGKGRVLEIGSGPVGVVAYFPGEHRIAVDPLEQFYSSNPVLTELRAAGVVYRQGVGEALPAESNAFDLVIIENCIDHVHDVDAVMSEAKRVLRADGLLYLTVNCRTRFGYVVHRLLSRLRIDAGHPHTFTPARTRSLLRRYDFELVQFEQGSFAEAWKQDLASHRATSRLKALLAVSEYLITVIAAPSPVWSPGSLSGSTSKPTASLPIQQSSDAWSG